MCVCVYKKIVIERTRDLIYLKSVATDIIGRAKRVPHRGVQSRFCVIYIYVCRGPKCVGRIAWPKHVHPQSQFWAVKIDL